VTGRKKRNPTNQKTEPALEFTAARALEMLNGELPSPPYTPTDREREILTKQMERQKAEPPVPRLSVAVSGTALRIVPDHPDERVGFGLLREAIGADSNDFVAGLLGQLGHVSMRDDKIDEGQLNYLFSVVRGIHPRDQLEAMLANEIANIHGLTILTAEQLTRCENLQHQESLDRNLNRLTRTFAILMETLKRYRTGGEQKVTVQHVSVSEGGQAIVGNVTQDVRESVPHKRANKSLASPHSRQQPMPIIEERRRERQSVSVAPQAKR
jgi:hypothetical protein